MLGEVIRKYRKDKNMTQEEMAGRLGVTAPAVNKWENGGSMPDITLLAPIARLLDISLDTLLSFQRELTDNEINEFVKMADEMFKTESVETVFAWIKKQLEKYPDCEKLALNLTIMLNAQGLMKNEACKELDNYVERTYERLLISRDEYIKTTAADSLYGLCIRREDYTNAEKYLEFFSDQNPQKKSMRAQLYEKTGRLEEAYKTYEKILFSCYQMTNMVLNNILMMRLKENNLEKAQYLTDKMSELAQLFEMGEYYEHSCKLELMQIKHDIEGTRNCVQHLMSGASDMFSYTNSLLYEHMNFKPVSEDFAKEFRKNLTELLKDDESFGYMKNDEIWGEIFERNEQ